MRICGRNRFRNRTFDNNGFAVLCEAVIVLSVYFKFFYKKHLTNQEFCAIITLLHSSVIRGDKMSENDRSTLNLIHKAAMEEFLEKGFKSASLRNIVKTAGVTTGAFYGYYGSKEDLFKPLVDKVYKHIMRVYKTFHKKFTELSFEEQPRNMGMFSQKAMSDILEYCCKNLNEIKLILECSEGTKYAFMIDEMVELEVEATHRYYETLEKLGRPAPPIDRQLEHILATGMLNAFFEVIRHEMPLDKARNYLSQLWDFQSAGWMKIMGQ